MANYKGLIFGLISFNSCCQANSHCSETSQFSMYIFIFIYGQRRMIKWKAWFGSKAVCIAVKNLLTVAELSALKYPPPNSPSQGDRKGRYSIHSVLWVSLFSSSSLVVWILVHIRVPSGSLCLMLRVIASWGSIDGKIALGVHSSVNAPEVQTWWRERAKETVTC